MKINRTTEDPVLVLKQEWDARWKRFESEPDLNHQRQLVTECWRAFFWGELVWDG